MQSTCDNALCGEFDDSAQTGAGSASDLALAPVRPLSLRRNFSWTLVGNATYAASQWGMLVVLAKLGSPEIVGQYTLGLAITGPVMLLASLQLRAVQATDARAEYRFGDYLGLHLLALVPALLVIVGIVSVSGYSRETILVVLAVGVVKALESISEIIYGLLQQKERMDRVARLQMIKGPLALCAMGVAVYATGSICWGAAAMAAVCLLRLLVTDLPSAVWAEGGYAQHIWPRWRWTTLSKLLWLSLPLGIASAFMSLEVNIPRIVVGQQLGEAQLGIFAAMAYVMVVGSTVTNALAHSATARLSQYFAAGHATKFLRLLTQLCGIGAMVGAVGVLLAFVAGRQILLLLYTPEFAVHHETFAWIALAFAVRFVYSFLNTAIRAMRLFRIELVTQLCSIGILSAICPMMVARFGLPGAAWALLIVTVLNTVAYLAILWWWNRASRLEDEDQLLPVRPSEGMT